MENRKETGAEKRRRKIVSRSVLVRSEKPGQVVSASYTRERSAAPFWRAA